MLFPTGCFNKGVCIVIRPHCTFFILTRVVAHTQHQSEHWCYLLKTSLKILFTCGLFHKVILHTPLYPAVQIIFPFSLVFVLKRVAILGGIEFKEDFNIEIQCSEFIALTLTASAGINSQPSSPKLESKSDLVLQFSYLFKDVLWNYSSVTQNGKHKTENAALKTMFSCQKCFFPLKQSTQQLYKYLLRDLWDNCQMLACINSILTNVYFFYVFSWLIALLCPLNNKPNNR